MGKTLAVFGAGPGFSYQVGRKYAQQGYSVALVSRTQKNLDALVERLKKEVPNATVKAFTADVTNQYELSSAIDAIFKEFHTIDAVFHCPTPASVTFTPAASLKVDDVKFLLELTFYSALTIAQAVLPGMIQRKEGALIFGMGASAVHPMPGMSGPGPVHAALRNWIHTLNLEVAKDGVYAGAIIVGAVILGSYIGDNLNHTIPAHFPRVQAEELGEIAWELYQKKELEREVPKWG